MTANPPNSPITIEAVVQCTPAEAIEVARKMALAGRVECHVKHVGHEGFIGIATPTGRLIMKDGPKTDRENRLLFEGCGCDADSDLGSYRIRTRLLNKEWKSIYLEISKGQGGHFIMSCFNKHCNETGLSIKIAGVVEPVVVGMGHVHPDSPKVGDVISCTDEKRHLVDRRGYYVECVGWSEGSGVPYGFFTARGVANGGLYRFNVREWKPFTKSEKL